ncbi:hypothetical protein AKJ48_04090 [candidate division MSBL1 archaeon SCGC-AAA261O19]|uniref:Pyridoxamine 5'-phosphate oxidase N-terminal domain-containing protein n=1 Tax=candidate division MSBL1 archaeon SCGC-AAA261O19 TaxID=1698277 RepID=A0A133V9V2_9EURY|nr:hypothetical protein AKJ48_04090 [candidate division MSBL1 archaeon SCGC-AAA261O19]
MEKGSWIHEFFLERVPPFSLFSRFKALILQLVIMEIIGLLCVIVFSLPIRSAIMGSAAILAVVVWSAIAHRMSLPIKRAKLPENPNDRDTVSKYRRLIFSKRHYEAIAGTIFAILLIFYIFFLGEQNLTFWLGSKIPVLPLGLGFLLLWEVSYRVGLGLWISLLALLRSSWLRKTVRERGGYVPYGSLDYLEDMDLRNMAMAFPTFLLIPLTLSDIALLLILLGIVVSIVTLSAISIFRLRQIPLYPDKIKELLKNGKFAYFGTSDENGQTHITPLIFVFDGRSVFIVTSKISKKLKNLQENPHAAVLIDVRDLENPTDNRAALLRGKTTTYSVFHALAHPIQMLRLRRLFQQKYPKYVKKYDERMDELPEAWRTALFIHRTLVRVDVEDMVYWEKAKVLQIPT